MSDKILTDAEPEEFVRQQVVNLEKQISTCISNYDKTVKLLFATEVERDKAYQVIDESHRMIIDEDTGRRWKELYKEAQKQIVKLKKQRRVGAEAIAELFGIADIINSFPEAPRSDGKEGALGRRVEGLIREQRQQLADSRTAQQNMLEAEVRLVQKLEKLRRELTEAQNTITQMREMLKDALELGLIAHAPGCSGGIRTSPRASDGEYPYPCKCGYVEWLEKVKEVTDGNSEQS